MNYKTNKEFNHANSISFFKIKNGLCELGVYLERRFD